MLSKWVWALCVLHLTLVQGKTGPRIIARTHTTHLEKYKRYSNAVILHFKVPEDKTLVSFRFQAEEAVLSLFACAPRDVTLYLKHGAPPIINPDGSAFPSKFLNNSRPTQHMLQFKSDNSKHYINLTDPAPGSYFGAAFLSYSDPKNEEIKQDGLHARCFTYLDATIYSQQQTSIYLLVPDKDFVATFTVNPKKIYKFYTPTNTTSAMLTIQNISYCDNCTNVKLSYAPFTVPVPSSALLEEVLSKDDYEGDNFRINVVTQDNAWHYIKLCFDASTSDDDNGTDFSEFTININYFSETSISTPNINSLSDESVTESGKGSALNNTLSYVTDIERSNYLGRTVPYKQYSLLKVSTTESFLYSYDLPPNSENLTPLSINLTNKEFSVLRFSINDGLDIGGTLQFSLAFKPRVTKINRTRIFKNEPKNHVIIACIRNSVQEVPSWPNHCFSGNNQTHIASINLNENVTNQTVYIPFPEPGHWYATFRLFCGKCEPCDCPASCQNKFKQCKQRCVSKCDGLDRCDACQESCQRTVVEQSQCTKCDCDGPCRRNGETCESAVVFLVQSYPCVEGGCGPNGNCMYAVSEGFAYSTCVCVNNYRGWDCSDNSQANSYGMVVLEFALLVFSNAAFLAATFTAYTREYYAESVVYFSTFFFSSFYHACDAGENMISFCLVRVSVLQFSDFFCGILSVWFTLIAMAHVPKPLTLIFQTFGTILIAFGTALDKTSLWVFALPFICGLVVTGCSWYVQYNKTKVVYPSKRYLLIMFPTGCVLVGSGLLMYALLETIQNYKYIHSLWHVLMALSIVILLPDRNTMSSSGSVIVDDCS